MQRLRAIFIVFTTTFLLWATLCSMPAHGASVDKPDLTPEVDGRYGSIVVDADSLDIIHARQIDAQRYPASLTKLMTLYLTFDALNSGQLTLNQKLPVSKNAQITPPGKLGIKQGQVITVDEAIQAVAVKSANDIAVVLAEAIGGTEAQFAEMMTARARSLGMVKTEFSNPHGLPNPLQVTTARDMAKLAMAHLNNHRRYYHYFGQKSFLYNGKTYKNTNGLLHWLPGVDGFKTGYTRASGYNLVISAQRDERRIIAVVLGGASTKSRNKHMQDLVEQSFEAIGVAPVPAIAPIKVASQKRKVVTEPLPKKNNVKTTSAPLTAVRLRGRDSSPVTVVTSGSPPLKTQAPALDASWSIQVGAFNSEAAAQAQVLGVSVMMDQDTPSAVLPIKQNGRVFYRARFTDLAFDDAHAKCRALGALKTGCAVISPNGR